MNVTVPYDTWIHLYQLDITDPCEREFAVTLIHSFDIVPIHKQTHTRARAHTHIQELGIKS